MPLSRLCSRSSKQKIKSITADLLQQLKVKPILFNLFQSSDWNMPEKKSAIPEVKTGGFSKSQMISG